MNEATTRITTWARGALCLLLGVLMAVAWNGVTATAQDLNMEEIFRCHGDAADDQALCAEGRDLIVNNCTACHTFVPIVLQQFDANGWQGLISRHRSRVGHLKDEQVDLIRTYLTLNFNPEQEPPELPPALLENWTSY